MKVTGYTGPLQGIGGGGGEGVGWSVDGDGGHRICEVFAYTTV